MTHRNLLAAAAILALACAGLALPQQQPAQQTPQQQTSQQQPKPQDENVVFQVQSQLVQIYLTVTEGNRRITELKLQDFTMSEDGIPREMERLDSTTVPLYVALLLDTSESMRDALAVTQEAAVSFIESLSPIDRVTLIPFNSDIRSIPQLTDDRGPIIQAVRSSQARGGTKLYDALLFAMKHLSAKEGRKAIVAFSDGEDTARSSSLNIVLNAAARYGYPIYTIGAGAGLKRDALKRILRQLADINSGKSYLVEDARDLRSTFQEVASELRSAYVLNYYTSVPYDGRWHDVKISVNNPHVKVHCRKGFYAKAGGTTSLFAELGEARKGQGGLRDAAEPLPEEKAAQNAVREILAPGAATRDVDIRPLRVVAPPPPRNEPKGPVFKVEARFVEVPVMLESGNDRELPTLSEKDFRVYEDDALREIAFFSREAAPQKLSDLRQQAMRKVNGGDSGAITLSSDSTEMRLGRYYVVLDDLMSDISSFMQAKKAAEKIVREHFSPLRPMSLHFTSEGSADVAPDDNVERLLERVRKGMPRSSRELTSNDNIINIYEAYLIERGDTQAAKLAELRYAASIFVQYRNDLGEVDGQTGISPEVIENTVMNNSRQLLSENFGQVSRALDGVRAVVNAAAADSGGDYPRTVIFISSGFSVGRGSGRADMAVMLDNIIKYAKQSKLRFFTVDASGLSPDEPLGIGASGSFLVRNPHLGSILSDHARGWRADRQSPLAQLAAETGGRFLHSNNDLAAAATSAMRTTGQLYYIGFLSKQQADGRFHRIRVTTAAPGARVHARKGYFAGRQNEPQTLAETSASGEDWNTLLQRANAARQSGDMKELATVLEQLVRRFPNQADLWFNLGVAHFNLGNAPRAVEALQKAFALSPDDRNTGLTLARALIAAGYRGAAGDTLEMLARKQPRDIDLLMNLGRVYEADARIHEAYQTYRRILDVALTPPLDLYVLLTRTSVRLGRHVEAGLFIDDYLSRGGSSEQIDGFRQLLPASASAGAKR
jgi:Ca-activated chloride channel family protein